jgi:hypothetical protein
MSLGDLHIEANSFAAVTKWNNMQVMVFCAPCSLIFHSLRWLYALAVQQGCGKFFPATFVKLVFLVAG